MSKSRKAKSKRVILDAIDEIDTAIALLSCVHPLSAVTALIRQVDDREELREWGRGDATVPDAVYDLVGAPAAVIEAVAWRLTRMRAALASDLPLDRT